MYRAILVLFLCFIHLAVFSQISDILTVQKKNGLTIKRFYKGSDITFQKKTGDYIQGQIKEIKNDSIFVTVYIRQSFQSIWGASMIDTVDQFTARVYYKDIKRVKIYEYHRFIRGKIGRLLRFGGAGYFLLNLVNGAYLNEPVTGSKNLTSLGIAAGAFGLGYILDKYFPVSKFSRKRHKISYIKIR